MSDPVFARFLHNSLREALDLAEQSERLAVTPLPPLPPSRYACELRLPYLRRRPTGEVDTCPGPVLVGIRFPAHYLRAADPALSFLVASVLTPGVFHPNIKGSAVCLGADFAPGTPIRHLLREIYDIVSYRNVTLDERNALDPEACRFLRDHPEVLRSLGGPPLRRRPPMSVTVGET